ncbi:glycosyltransferase family 4 protein [bacterium]|nr:glycosyltransferase family 4 protein [bacterium]
MKILQLVQSFLPRLGGMELMTHHLANELMARGHDVVVMAAEVGPGAEDALAPFGPRYRILRYPIKRFGSLLGRTPRSMLAIMDGLRNEFPFEIIHAHALHYPGYVAMRAGRRFHVPAAVTEHGQFMLGLSETKGQWRNPQIRCRIRSALRNIDAVTAPNAEVFDKLISHRSINPDLSRCIPNAIAVPPPDRVDALIEQNRAGAGRILMVGRNDPVKSYATAIRALAILLGGGADVSLTIVGNATDQLEPLVHELRIPADRVTLSPPRLGEDLWREYASADLYWMTSLRECQSLVKLEAMSFALPGVFNDAPGVRDQIEPEKNGLIFDANDPADLARKTTRLLGDANLCDRIAAGARELGDRYRWSNMIEQYEKLYRDLIESLPRH